MMEPENHATKQPPPRPWLAPALFAGLAIVLVGICQISFETKAADEAGVNMVLPERMLGMRGEDQEVSEGERVILPKDTEFAKRSYADSFGNVINCQIVLSGSDSRSIHRPEVCLPGQGWSQRSSERIQIELESGEVLQVTLLDLVRQVEVAPNELRPLPMLFAYWFVGKDYTTPDNIDRILRTNMDLLFYNKMHRWAYLIVSAPVLRGFTTGGKDREQTLEDIKSAIREMVPVIHKSEMPPVNVEA